MFQANHYKIGEQVSILKPVSNYYGTCTSPHTFTVVGIEEGQPTIYSLYNTDGTLVWATADILTRARR